MWNNEMTPDHRDRGQDIEQKLLSFGDDVGETSTTPRDDLEATLLRVQHAAGIPAIGTDTIPAALKTAIWEDLMHTPTSLASVTRFDGPEPRPSPARIWRTPDRPWQQSISRWQPGVSIALVMAFLLCLLAIAYQAGPASEPNDQGTVAANQVVYDPNGLSSYPAYPETCVSNGDVTTDDELATQSLDRWPVPQYVPAKPVTEETGRAIQETFINYMRCEQELYATWTLSATASPPSPVQSPLIQSYFSDRARFDHLFSTLPSEQQAAVASYRCLPRLEQIQRDFPLPVNQPNDYIVRETATDGTPKYLGLIFAPSDVYLMPDGRYGAIAGSVSAAQLQNPALIPQTSHPVFYAFTEVDGRYYIDEIFNLFVNQADADASGRNGSLSTDCE